MKKKKICLISLLAILALTCITGITIYTIAKYRESHQSSTDFQTDKFYFTSNLMRNTEDSITIDLYGNRNQNVKFYVMNYYDKERICPSDIAFDTSFKETSTYVKEDKVSLSVETKVLKKDIASKSLIEMNIQAGFEEGDKVELDVKSTSPYEKTLHFVFVLHTANTSSTFEVLDASDNIYATLNIYTVSGADIVISWNPNNLMIDNTSSYVVDENGMVIEENIQGTLSIHLDANCSTSIRFYKVTMQENYSVTLTNLDSNQITLVKK